MKTGLLVIFAGLPGVGKTAIARELAGGLNAVYLRVDSLEHAFAASGVIALNDIGPAGYMAAGALATDNLRLGHAVIVDSVNPWPLTRGMWREAASRAGAESFGIEVVCSDSEEHRRRVESRTADIAGFKLPTWDDVLAREYSPWEDADLRLDTAELSVRRAAEAAMGRIAARCYRV